MPANGWPVVLFGHDLGENYRSLVTSGLAKQIAESSSAGASGRAATLTVEPVHHGARGTAGYAPGALVYNFGNPLGARGNVIQAAADHFTSIALAAALKVNLPGSSSLHRLDTNRLAYVGHGFGATTGVMAAAFEKRMGAVVLAGAGAGLVGNLITAKSPVAPVTQIERVLVDTPSVDHPVMGVVQQLMDVAESGNYASFLTKNAPPEVGAHHVLIVYGVGDQATSGQSTRVLADLIGAPVVEPLLDSGPGQPFKGAASVAGPLSLNFYVQGKDYTVGVGQHTPPDFGDGHDVIFTTQSARDQVAHFVGTYFADGSPVIVSP